MAFGENGKLMSLLVLILSEHLESVFVVVGGKQRWFVFCCEEGFESIIKVHNTCKAAST